MRHASRMRVGVVSSSYVNVKTPQAKSNVLNKVIMIIVTLFSY